MESKPRIFIVDDDEMLTMMMSDHLSRQDKYKIEEFSTGEECLNSLDQKPHFVVLDYNLDSAAPMAQNGVEIAKKIKEALPHTGIVMHTSEAAHENAQLSLKYGALACIMKDGKAFTKIETIIETYIDALDL